ncbi:MAG: hypothetical protein HDR44_04665 [Allobaculum sp.]|nr:hypothetical protein [Allobaculum sp.]
MIELISVSGCPRMKSVKQLAKEMGISLTEKNLFKLLLDSNKKKNMTCLLEIAHFYGVSIEALQQNPSLVSRPLLRITKELTPNQQLFLENLVQKNFYPNCPKQCLKRSVCPASQKPIDIIGYDSKKLSEIGKKIECA